MNKVGDINREYMKKIAADAEKRAEERYLGRRPVTEATLKKLQEMYESPKTHKEYMKWLRDAPKRAAWYRKHFPSKGGGCSPGTVWDDELKQCVEI